MWFVKLNFVCGNIFNHAFYVQLLNLINCFVVLIATLKNAMIEAQGPNVEEHLWVDSNVLWMTTKDKHNKVVFEGCLEYSYDIYIYRRNFLLVFILLFY
jgi:hypothetical protein